MNSTKIQQQYSLQKWAGIIKEQQASGQSISRWVSENNVKRDAFFYWKRKLKDTVLDSVASGFVELPIAPLQTDNVPVVKVVQPPQPTMVSNETVATITVGSSTINIYGNASQDFLSVYSVPIVHPFRKLRAPLPENQCKVSGKRVQLFVSYQFSRGTSMPFSLRVA